MSFTKFFSNKKFRGSQQTHIKNIILGTPKQQTSSQGWIKQEKIGKISPNSGMEKWVLWRPNQRSTARMEDRIARSYHIKFEPKSTLFGLPSYKMIKTPTHFFLLLKTLFPCFFSLFGYCISHTSSLFLICFFFFNFKPWA